MGRNTMVAGLVLAMSASTAMAAEVELGPGSDVRTLTAALQPGDVYIFEDGVYELADRMVWNGVGTEAQPIVLRAAKGAAPVFRLASGGEVAAIEDAAFITVEGLTFEGTDTLPPAAEALGEHREHLGRRVLRLEAIDGEPAREATLAGAFTAAGFVPDHRGLLWVGRDP